MRFMDRTDAGRHLARSLEWLRGSDSVVLGLPRGGVPVAFEVAAALGAPLDVIVVRKLGVPYQPELAMGAIGEGGIRVSNDEVIRRGGITSQEIAAVEQRERADLERQARQFRAGRPHVGVAGRTAVIVDDGVATGSTAAAACQVARQMGASRVILAVPVGAPESLAALRNACDEVVCPYAPAFFMAVGTFYDDFRHVPDQEVTDLLTRANDAAKESVTSGGGTVTDLPTQSASQTPATIAERDEDVDLQVADGRISLAGHLTRPANAAGTVIFVHGSGSSRLSPRNAFVAGPEEICPGGKAGCVQGGTGGIAFLSWDARVSKFFRFGSKDQGVELTADVFNITNHVNFNTANPGGYINRYPSNNFGSATAIVPNSQREAQFGARFRF